MENCEICKQNAELSAFTVDPKTVSVNLCATCSSQISASADLDANHWRCLNDSIWSEVAAVQVLSWRMLNRLKAENWAQDLLEMMYLDDDNLAWAKATGEGEEKLIHKDCNGNILEAGDTVILIKELKVKGANFSAKRGTAVRRISLVADNAGQIEGRVNNQQIVILTEFVKKSK